MHNAQCIIKNRETEFKIQNSEFKNKEQRTNEIPLRYACGMENNVETQRAASDFGFCSLIFRVEDTTT